VVEHRVRGGARAGSYVAIAGRRDVSQRFGRRLALLRPARQLHLHLEYEVDLDRVVEVKRIGTTAVISLADAMSRRFRRLGAQGRSTSSCLPPTPAAPLWQIAHPPQGLIDAFAEEPEVPPEWNLDFASALTRLLTATCVGLLSESH
jgi:hypothetical protein